MAESVNSTVVAISDSNYFPGVLLLVLSLRYFKVRTVIHVLGINFTERERQTLEQFPNVHVFAAAQDNVRTPATRKAEAIFTARDNGTDFISILDADCLVTGDISEYLTPGPPAFYGRLKSDAEDRHVFASRYDRVDRAERPHPVLPHRVMDIWRTDVGENDHCAIRNTFCGGNLTIHRDYLGFVEHWHNQILKVLPNEPGKPHNWDYFAYFQTDESVLNSLLAFAADAPPLRRGKLDLDHHALVAHLGPNQPKPWVCWRGDRVHHLPLVFDFVRWAREQGFDLPDLPWTYEEKRRHLIYGATAMFECYRLTRKAGRRVFDFTLGRR